MNILREDSQRRLWLGTDNGMFRLARSGAAWRVEPVDVPGLLPEGIRSIHPESEGRLWLGLSRGLLRLDPDRRVGLYTVQGHTLHAAGTIVEHGMLWVALNFGLLAFRLEPLLEAPNTIQRNVLNPRRSCVTAHGEPQAERSHAFPIPEAYRATLFARSRQRRRPALDCHNRRSWVSRRHSLHQSHEDRKADRHTRIPAWAEQRQRCSYFRPPDDDGSVLVFYSHGAADLPDLHQNSVIHTGPHPPPASLLCTIQIWIDATNQSFWDGGVATRMNLLWNTALESADLVDSGDFEEDLDAWVNLGSIQAARGFAADIVVFVTGSHTTGGKFNGGQFAILGAQSQPLSFAQCSRTRLAT